MFFCSSSLSPETLSRRGGIARLLKTALGQACQYCESPRRAGFELRPTRGPPACDWLLHELFSLSALLLPGRGGARHEIPACLRPLYGPCLGVFACLRPRVSPRVFACLRVPWCLGVDVLVSWRACLIFININPSACACSCGHPRSALEVPVQSGSTALADWCCVQILAV